MNFFVPHFYVDGDNYDKVRLDFIEFVEFERLTDGSIACSDYAYIKSI